MRTATRPQRASVNLNFGGGSSTTLGVPAIGSPAAAANVVGGMTGDSAETGGGGGGGGGDWKAAAGGGACGTTISFWQDGQLIRFPE